VPCRTDASRTDTRRLDALSMSATEDELGRIRCVADIVRVHAEQRGGSPGLVCGGHTLTFAGLYQRSKAVAGALAGAGVGAQDRVAVIERNSIEVLEIVFGAALCNAVVVNVNWRLAPPEILHILADAGTDVVLVGPEFFGALEAIRVHLGNDVKIVAFGPHAEWEAYEPWLARHAPTDPGIASAPGEVAFQLYTSGTTGQPKGVMLTTSNLMTAYSNIEEQWGLEPGRSVSLALMPMFHIAGLGWATAGLYHGCRTVVLADVDPTGVLETLSSEGITHGFMVPAVIQMLLQTPGVENADFRSLRKLLYGASPIAAAVLEQALEVMGCDFIQLYGLTETTGAITQLQPEEHDPAGRPGLLRSCGRPYPWVELRVVDPDTGRDAPAGQVGELWTRSRQNMAGYWNNPSATAAVIDGSGWLRTGDAGYVDDDGFVYLHDRVKDMIVTGGENVYPAEVENALMRHPAVADAAVFGVPDERWGEAVKAAVVIGGGADVSGEELIAFCRQYLAGYKCPKSVDFAEALPRNPSGKLLKRELRAPYWEGSQRQVG
jgi:long-chain acyl-CoA synthetase